VGDVELVDEARELAQQARRPDGEDAIRAGVLRERELARLRHGAPARPAGGGSRGECSPLTLSQSSRRSLGGRARERLALEQALEEPEELVHVAVADRKCQRPSQECHWDLTAEHPSPFRTGLWLQIISINENSRACGSGTLNVDNHEFFLEKFEGAGTITDQGRVFGYPNSYGFADEFFTTWYFKSDNPAIDYLNNLDWTYHPQATGQSGKLQKVDLGKGKAAYPDDSVLEGIEPDEETLRSVHLVYNCCRTYDEVGHLLKPKAKGWCAPQQSPPLDSDD
jgi:hypothetical protein